MGMAASQARLLCITARIHDVEYQAQAIQGAKVQLATESDQVYEDYLAALDASVLTMNTIDTITGNKSIVAATFNNMCSKNRLTSADGSIYALRNNNGLLIVEDEIAKEYNSGKYENAYEFAMHMINAPEDLQTIVIPGKADFQAILTEAEESVYNSLSDAEKGDLKALHEKLEEFILSGDGDIYAAEDVSEEDRSDYQATLAEYRQELYAKYAAQINEYMYTNNEETSPIDSEDFDMNMFNYYISRYNQIKSCGGCESISKYGENAGNDSEWLTNMVESGQISISIVNNGTNSEKLSFSATSPGSDTCLSYTATTTIDSRAQAKAEAEYEHKMKQINSKDKKYDLDLSKLETERSALTTEYDSVTKVIEDNVKRTFGIFS